jgi:hypothetical protein
MLRKATKLYESTHRNGGTGTGVLHASWRSPKAPKVVAKEEASVASDFLVSAWVLFIAFAICGVITLFGFPVGWKEAGTDYSSAKSELITRAQP